MTAEDLLSLLDAEIPTITADRSDLARLATLTRYAQTCLKAVELADISRRIRALEQTLAER
ncbi:MAG TPA: hypothetical protein VFP94_00025 [Terriglobales bacterium]|nr:hypothetical protein [Terriglobales bacterium]